MQPITASTLLGLVALATLNACATVARNAPSSANGPDSTRIREDIRYLASDALEGRGTGTPGNDSAAAFVARRYAALGLRPLAPGYIQPFDARSAMLAHASGPAGLRTQNVVALLPGADRRYRGQ